MLSWQPTLENNSILLENIPFAWTLRLSKRAKRPKISINSYGHVELVWPVQMSEKYMSPMLKQHESWVLNQLSRLSPLSPTKLALPSSIVLPSIDQIWPVHYQQQPRLQVRVLEKKGILYVSGNVQDKEKVRLVLCRWVKKQAEQHLSYWLADVASSMGQTYQSLSIRLQKRRWGSCSAAKRINLNAALLFLPPLLVEHVLIHELTHLIHFNHSQSFWLDVEKHDKTYRENRRLLRKHAADAPVWLTEKFEML